MPINCTNPKLGNRKERERERERETKYTIDFF